MSSRLTAKTLDADMQQEVADSARLALDNLQLPPSAPPEAVVRAIMTYADQTRPLEHDKLEEAAVTLGCLWAEQVRAALGWEWVELEEQGEFWGYGVASPERSLVVLPMSYLQEVLATAERDNTIMLLFNMLAAGNVPPSRPGELHHIS